MTKKVETKARAADHMKVIKADRRQTEAAVEFLTKPVAREKLQRLLTKYGSTKVLFQIV